MGFFFNETRSAVKKKSNPTSLKGLPTETLAKMGCSACPLNTDGALKFEPTGSSQPLVYLLRSAPSDSEERSGVPFSDESAKELLSKVPGKVSRYVRYGYSVRCKAQNPGSLELACCSKHLLADIEESKPLVVVGLGAAPMQILTGLPGGPTRWRGRMVACKVGSHSFWLMPTYDPEFLNSKKGKYGPSEYDLAASYDLRNVLFRDVDIEIKPPVTYQGDYDRGIEIITGQEQGDIDRLETALHRILKYPKVAIDLETNGLRPYIKDPKIWTVSIGTFDDVVAFPLDHPDAWYAATRSKVWCLLANFMLNSGLKLAHNLAFEQEWLAEFFGGSLLRKTEWGDTLAQSHTLNETKGTHSLDVLTREHFGFYLKDQSPVNPARFVTEEGLRSYPIKEVLRYNGMDSKWCHRLDSVLMPKILSNPKYLSEYERKVRLCPTLVLTQLKGMRPDIEYAETLWKQLTSEVEMVEAKLTRCPEIREFENRFRRKFSPSAPDDVLIVMRDILGRSEVRKKEGGYSSDVDVLSSIPADEAPSASLVLEYRGAAKLLSTYITPILNGEMLYADGKIHTKYSSMVAVTGRLSSEEPNLQNFPKRKRKEVRGVIASAPGKWLVACDYGQIEARVIGMASEDLNLVKYLWTGYDIHGYWADRILAEYPRTKDRIISSYQVNCDDAAGIRKKLRDETKNMWVFPQFFGSSSRSCAANLQIPEDIADDLAKEFWDEFPGVLKWQKKIMEGYSKNLYVETLTGRRRRGAMTKNEIINMPIQGTAADIVTEAMTALSVMADIDEDEELQASLNVHDDLTFEISDFTIDAKIPIIATEMCRHRFPFINVPLIVEVQVGERWHEIKEIGVYRSNEIFNLRSPT